LIIGITLISLLSSSYEVRVQKQGQRRDLEHRADVVGESLADKIEPLLKKGTRKELQLVIDRFGSGNAWLELPSITLKANPSP